jgi:hypothetical protein
MLISPDFREGGSEQIGEGAQISENRPKIMLGGFAYDRV